MKATDKLITTVKELCRVCYTCVRDCPAKAIRISGGQAEVIPERCIGCGNCVQVCSQNAKRYYNSIDEVMEILAGRQKKAAIIAPSFPADFPDLEYGQMVGVLRALGFDIVSEVSFGADLVAQAYKKLVKKNSGKPYIATTCPSVVAYVEKYHPALVDSLAPIASPMVVTARVLKKIYSDNIKIVFIGPCFAKKGEAIRYGQKEDIQAALTFLELRRMLKEAGIDPPKTAKSAFDPPVPGLGSLFPISGGMIQAANMREDLLSEDIVTSDGKSNFSHAIKEFEDGALKVRLLEVLCCQGCIMGPGMSSDQPFFTRRTAVSRYARERLKTLSVAERERQYRRFAHIDLTDTFKSNDMRIQMPSKNALNIILQEMGKVRPEDELNCGACGYPTCQEHAIAIYRGLAEAEMCLPYTIDLLKHSLNELNVSNSKLAETQQALITAEKMAGMGQLSAGIAHEINNPLGVILLYSRILLDEYEKDSEEYEDLCMIVEQAERCKNIVSGLLNFARKNETQPKETDITDLLNHCLKAIIIPANITIKVDHKMDDPLVEVDANQIVQVITNLVKNAIDAMPEGGIIEICTKSSETNFTITVKDSGTGIPPKVMKKIFEPLFTTKETGKGTGLGLAVAYGIIKMHYGKIDVVSNADPVKGATGTTFMITLPRKVRKQKLLNNAG